MSDPVQVTTKAEPVHAPYKCPACGKWADSIGVTINQGLAVMYHEHCKAILGVQLLQMPKQSQPMITVPGGPLH